MLTPRRPAAAPSRGHGDLSVHSGRMLRHIPYFLILALVSLYYTASPVLALSPQHSYELFFEPKATADDGTGVFALSFNAPYYSIRHVVDSTAPEARITFETVPVLPRGATLHNWVWAPITNASSLPPWLSYVGGWGDSPAFALHFNGAEAVKQNASPQPFVLKLGGVVHYSHGPERFLEQEERLLFLTVHMHVKKTIASRSSILADFFIQDDVTEAGIHPFRLRSPAAAVPSFTMEAGESYTFACGGSLGDLNGACTLGTEHTAEAAGPPIWVGEGAMIVVKSGVLRVRAPLACWGAIAVMDGATLLIDGPAEGTLFAVMSEERVPAFVNHGHVYVKQGLLRLSGTAMLGFGTVFVATNGTLELSPRQEAAFGDQPASSSTDAGRPVVLESRGRVNIVAGTLHFPRAIVSVGLGSVNIGMAASVVLGGRAQHVLGGVGDGEKKGANGTAEDGVNAVGAVVSGALTLSDNASILIAGGLRLQGLGTLTLRPGSVATVDVVWSDPVLYPSAGIVATGPAVERPSPGVTVTDALLRLVRGGLTSASALTVTGSKASVDIGPKGFLHLASAAARNVIGGKQLLNRGDITLLGGASVDFAAPVISTTHVRALDPRSAIIFSSTSTSTLSREAGARVATTTTTGSTGSSAGFAADPTHLFALFTPGIVLVRGGASLRLLASEPPTGAAATRETARFFAATVYNAGEVEIAEAAVLESAAVVQSFEPKDIFAFTATDDSESADKNKNIGFVAGDVDESTGGVPAYPAPSMAPTSSLSSVVIVPESRYKYHATGDLAGTISQHITPSTFSAAPIALARGALAGAQGGSVAAPVVLSARSAVSPGADAGWHGAKLDAQGRVAGPAWPRPSKKAGSAAAAARDAAVEERVGVLKVRSLKAAKDAVVRIDVIGAGPPGVGYDQVIVDGGCDLGDGAMLNISTSFEAFVRQAASTATLRAVEQRRFLTADEGSLPEGASDDHALRADARRIGALDSDGLGVLAARARADAEVMQWVQIEDDEDDTGSIKARAAMRSSDAEDGVTLGANGDRYRPLGRAATPGVGRPRGPEVLRVPILLASEVKGRFSRINVQWLTSDDRAGASSTPADKTFVVASAADALRERAGAGFKAAVAAGSRAKGRVWDFSVEYTDTSVVLVAWENAASSDAPAAAAGRGWVIAVSTVAAVLGALWLGRRDGDDTRRRVMVKYD